AQTTRLALIRPRCVGRLPFMRAVLQPVEERQLVEIRGVDGTHLKDIIGTNLDAIALAFAAVAVDLGRERRGLGATLHSRAIGVGGGAARLLSVQAWFRHGRKVSKGGEGARTVIASSGMPPGSAGGTCPSQCRAPRARARLRALGGLRRS